MAETDKKWPARGLYKSYQRAGPGFLAYRLEKLFVQIDSEKDVALHNEALSELLQIIEGEETQFFKGMADYILHPPESRIKTVRRKRFLFRLAGQILHIGQKKG